MKECNVSFFFRYKTVYAVPMLTICSFIIIATILKAKVKPIRFYQFNVKM